jgi:site-specific recombinase XerD
MTIRVVPYTEVVAIRATPLTINELVERYTISNQADGKSRRTVAWYADIIAQFLKYFETGGHQFTLSDFSMDVVRGYVLFLQRRPRFQGHPFIRQRQDLLSPKTVQCHVRALKAFSTWLYEEEYTNVNRLKNLKLPKATAKMMEPLKSEEIRMILSSINRKSHTGGRNRAVLATLLDSGLRASELASITLDKLNLSDGYIRVTGKGDKERVVPIGRFVQTELMHYIEKVRSQVCIDGCNNLFLSQGGRPMTLNTVKIVFSRLAKLSGVDRLHAHLCRHTFAVNYLLNGGDIFSLREILGHTTLAMVNHYLHFTSSQITTQHRKYSPMDRIQLGDGKEQGNQ